jgi:hypothetical protein
MIGAGWGPGGVSARPTREVLAEAVHRTWAPSFLSSGVPDRLHASGGDSCWVIADGLLAADHLWATPDATLKLDVLDTLAESGLSPDDEATQQLAHILSTQIAAHDALLRSVVEREAAARALEAFKGVVRGEGELGHAGEMVAVNYVEELLDEEAAQYREGKR